MLTTLKTMNPDRMTHPQLHSYDLSPMVTAFSTMRQGGVGEGSYASFNINNYCGDSADAIAENTARLCRHLAISRRQLVFPHQTHSASVLCIDDDFMQLGYDARAARLEGIDALVTDLSRVCIGVSTADCIPILIFDTANHVVAAVHAGWRGTVARIVEATLGTMAECYGTHAADCKAVVGPGISLHRFEVGDEVYDAFRDAGFNMQYISRAFPVDESVESRGWKWHLDLPECNGMQLRNMGVAPENIHMAGICTYDNVDRFFSARRLGIDSGRIFTGIMMK